MFKYVDHFFPDEEYNKLVVHFTINDIAFAEVSLTDFQRENTSLPSDASVLFFFCTLFTFLMQDLQQVCVKC